MRVFKTTYKDRKGRRREASKWYVEFRDPLEYTRRLPAFESKAASEELGRNLEKMVAYHKSSGGQMDPALTRFLAGLPTKLREKLVSIGLLAADRVAVAKPLTEHLEDFAAALTAKGSTLRHIKLVTGRARRVFNGCGFRFYGDIRASKVMEYLNGLRADTENKRGISAQTFNFHLQACKQFCRWMVRDRRALDNPLSHLQGLNVKTDRRHDRRPLGVDELRRLLTTTRTGPERFGMAGADRSILYWLAVETGLRAGEVRSLIRASFALDADPPTVTVDAAYSKRRREDTVSLRPALAAELRAFLRMLARAATVFPTMPSRQHLAEMFRADLEAAGIAYRDEAGLFADFHSLRHTFISNLAGAGVHPKTAQTLARHSTITLTMDRYSHTLREQEAEALAVLPDLAGPAPESLRATGTSDPLPVDACATGRERVLASCLALSERSSEPPIDCVGREGQETAGEKNAANPRENRDLPGKNSGEGGIRTREGASPLPVFETGPFGRSGTSPYYH